MNKYNIVAETSENTVVTEYEPVKARSDSYQSEAALEKEFIRLLCEQGYDYLPIHTEKDLTSNLRTKLEELNGYAFSDAEWERFFSDAVANPNEHIVEKTRKIQEDFVQVLKRDDGTTKNITLIDKKNIHNNHLQVINQYEVGTDDGAKHGRSFSRRHHRHQQRADGSGALAGLQPLSDHETDPRPQHQTDGACAIYPREPHAVAARLAHVGQGGKPPRADAVPGRVKGAQGVHNKLGPKHGQAFGQALPRQKTQGLAFARAEAQPYSGPGQGQPRQPVLRAFELGGRGF